MADTRVSVASSVNADGTTPALRVNRSADLYVADLPTQWALEGRVFVANRGTATTPVSFAKTAYDEDQPQLVLRVPEGTTIIPLYCEVVLEDSAGTDNEIIWGVTANDIGNGTSTAVTPYNVLSVGGKTTAVTVRRDYTGNATAASQVKELGRFGYAFADASTDPAKRFVLQFGNDRNIVPIKGADSLNLWVAGATTAPSGYATVVWAEFLSTELF